MKTHARVVVIGGGMAGMSVAKYLRLWGNGIEVTLVERAPVYTSCIMSSLVLTGQRSLPQLTYRYDAFANTGTVGTAFHMDLAYPDFASAARRFCDNGAASLNDTLRTLDGVYFSGGDQARHHLELVAEPIGREHGGGHGL